MNRRDFIIGTGAGLGAVWPGSTMLTPNLQNTIASDTTPIGNAGILTGGQGETMSDHSHQAERTYHVLGVPLQTGSLYPGNETTLRLIAMFTCLRACKQPDVKRSMTATSRFPAIFPTTRSLRSGAGLAHGSPGTVSASVSRPICNNRGTFRC